MKEELEQAELIQTRLSLVDPRQEWDQYELEAGEVLRRTDTPNQKASDRDVQKPLELEEGASEGSQSPTDHTAKTGEKSSSQDAAC